MWDIERKEVENTDDTNELSTLRKEKRKLQEECSKLLDKQYEDDYRLENMKKRVEYFVKKVEDFEKENKALRELVKLWS